MPIIIKLMGMLIIASLTISTNLLAEDTVHQVWLKEIIDKGDNELVTRQETNLDANKKFIAENLILKSKLKSENERLKAYEEAALTLAISGDENAYNRVELSKARVSELEEELRLAKRKVMVTQAEVDGVVNIMNMAKDISSILERFNTVEEYNLMSKDQTLSEKAREQARNLYNFVMFANAEIMFAHDIAVDDDFRSTIDTFIHLRKSRGHLDVAVGILEN